MDDVFTSCNESAARAAMRHGIYEWEEWAELSAHPVLLMIGWQPEYDGRLEDIVALARQAWRELQRTELQHRRAALTEVNRHYRWLQAQLEQMHPTTVQFLPDGAAEIIYGGIETGGHMFVAEISAAGEYTGYRMD